MHVCMYSCMCLCMYLGEYVCRHVGVCVCLSADPRPTREVHGKGHRDGNAKEAMMIGLIVMTVMTHVFLYVHFNTYLRHVSVELRACLSST